MAQNIPSAPPGQRRVSDDHPELLHYTSIHALRGLLESDTVWATQTTHLNDTSEMGQIVRSLQKACIDRLRKLTGEQGWERPRVTRFARKLGAATRLAFEDALSGPRSASVFVASFSSAEREYIRRNGMLSQWRGYGGSDNVAVVFDAKRLECLLQREAGRFVYRWCDIHDVLYDTSDLKLDDDRFRPLVDEIGNLVRNLARHEHDDADRVSNDRLVEELPATMAQVKHGAFEEETECRIVAVRLDPAATDAPQALEPCTRPAKPIHHRPGRHGSIPYIRLFEGLKEANDGTAQLPITEVLVGPSRNQEAHYETVKELVVRYGGGPRRIRVRKSEIPFVGSS